MLINSILILILSNAVTSKREKSIFYSRLAIIILIVSIFISIELQSYGLYLLSTLYRNSELATTSGLTYFLLGGLSSCFILLGTSLLYANSGTTSLEHLYVITSISDIVHDNVNNSIF